MLRHKFFFATAVLCLVLFTAQAQTHSLGPTIGLNYSTVSNSNDANYRSGINYGIVYNYSKLVHSGFGLEARFSQEGVKNTLTGADTRLNYLRVPLKFQYFFGARQDDVRPKMYIGPSMGFLLNDNYRSSDSRVVTNVNGTDYNAFDLGLMGGLGLNIRLQPATWLNFDVAYTHGLTDVAKSAGVSVNRTVNINLGVAWGF
jgi:Outer membrane protein beta-barrel domain